jgi:hypothetical protein
VCASVLGFVFFWHFLFFAVVFGTLGLSGGRRERETDGARVHPRRISDGGHLGCCTGEGIDFQRLGRAWARGPVEIEPGFGRVKCIFLEERSITHNPPLDAWKDVEKKKPNWYYAYLYFPLKSLALE